MSKTSKAKIASIGRYKKRNPEKVKMWKHTSYLRHKEEVIQKQRDYHKNPKVAKHYSQLSMDAVKRNRLKVIELLGGKCSNPVCPISPEKMDIRALTIDHIHGGGRQHYLKRKTAGILIDILKDSNPRERYQLLCIYCNWIKRYEKHELN